MVIVELFALHSWQCTVGFIFVIHKMNVNYNILIFICIYIYEKYNLLAVFVYIVCMLVFQNQSIPSMNQRIKKGISISGWITTMFHLNTVAKIKILAQGNNLELYVFLIANHKYFKTKQNTHILGIF